MTRALALLILFLPLLSAAQELTCSIYNTSWTQPFADADWTYHGSGEHADSGSLNGGCNYTGSNNSGPCSIYCYTAVPNTTSEYGLLTNPITEHVLSTDPVIGTSNSNGPAMQCGAQFIMAVNSCIWPIGCNFSVSINGSVNGIGGSASFSSTPIWHSATHNYSNTCGAKNAPPCVPDGDPPPGDGAAGYYVWDSTICAWVWNRLGNTPVIIDTDGSGFHLTSAAEGIKWDFFGNGHAIQIAWTAKGSTNGWLAMPNSKGQITSARQLFSNLANQPTPPAAIGPNGFNALKLYDTNGDGLTDKNDYPYWSEMRVWIDSNHDGVAQPGELHTLDSIGIGSISLGYTPSPLTDKNGNQFRLKGSLNPDKTDKVDRVIYDVTLATAN